MQSGAKGGEPCVCGAWSGVHEDAHAPHMHSHPRGHQACGQGLCCGPQASHGQRLEGEKSCHTSKMSCLTGLQQWMAHKNWPSPGALSCDAGRVLSGISPGHSSAYLLGRCCFASSDVSSLCSHASHGSEWLVVCRTAARMITRCGPPRSRTCASWAAMSRWRGGGALATASTARSTREQRPPLLPACAARCAGLWACRIVCLVCIVDLNSQHDWMLAWLTDLLLSATFCLRAACVVWHGL